MERIEGIQEVSADRFVHFQGERSLPHQHDQQEKEATSLAQPKAYILKCPCARTHRRGRGVKTHRRGAKRSPVVGWRDCSPCSIRAHGTEG